MTIVRRDELSDDDWALIAPLLPVRRRGGTWNDHRIVMNGMFWVLRSGSAWRDMPERYGKWQTIDDRFTRWRRDGTLDMIARGPGIKVAPGDRHAWRAALGGGDGRAEPREPVVRTRARIGAATSRRGLAEQGGGRQGYSYPSIAVWLANREIESVIPQRGDQIKRNGKAPLDQRAYRKRNVVERCVSWLKENRRPGTRDDKLAAGFTGFVSLAFIRRYLRPLLPSDTPSSPRRVAATQHGRSWRMSMLVRATVIVPQFSYRPEACTTAPLRDSVTP